MKDGLYFLHIPKTAGTSVISILQDYFPREKVCPCKNLHEFLTWPPKLMREYEFFAGHYYSSVERVIGFIPNQITFLRDPVDRYISHFKQIQRSPWHPLHKYSATLEQFVTSSPVRWFTNNLQTRWIAADIDPAIEVGDRSGLEILAELEKAFQRQPTIKIAKERLKSFAFVGFVETFYSSIIQMCRTFEWELPESVPRLNGIESKEDVPFHLIREIRKLNLMDFELYESVAQKQKRFE